MVMEKLAPPQPSTAAVDQLILWHVDPYSLKSSKHDGPHALTLLHTHQRYLLMHGRRHHDLDGNLTLCIGGFVHGFPLAPRIPRYMHFLFSLSHDLRRFVKVKELPPVDVGSDGEDASVRSTCVYEE